MIRSNLCDNSYAYIHAKETIAVLNTAAEGANPNNRKKKVAFKTCAPFIDFISRINNTQVDDAHDIDAVMSMYNLTEYTDNYSETSGCLWQFYRDEPALNNNVIINFPADDNNSNSFKFKQKITGETKNHWVKDVEIMISLKYLSNF